MKNYKIITRKLAICNLVRAITVSLACACIIGCLAMVGEPAPGEEAMSITKIIAGESICFIGAVFFGKLYITMSECAAILKRRISKSRG